MRYDVAVIGSGPGGFAAAVRCAELGLKVVCIEKEEVFGGTCLNVGCIPSKALLSATEKFTFLRDQGKDWGYLFEGLSVDLAKLMAKKDEIVSHLRGGMTSVFAKHKIECIKGVATFASPHHLRIHYGNETVAEVEASYIVIATGSFPIALKELPFDGRLVISSTEALNLKSVPERLFVIGGGVIGVEMASVYQRLGSAVTVIEMQDHICPPFDKNLSHELKKELEKIGIRFFLSSQLVTATVQSNEVILTMVKEDKKVENHSASKVLVAVGRRPNTTYMECEKAGIAIDKGGFIEVDSAFRTSQSHIFAVGDVIRGPMLAHRASIEALAVAELICGYSSVLCDVALPSVIYTAPEVFSVGLTEEELLAAQVDYIVGKSMMKANGRSHCSGEIAGFVKLLADKKEKRLLGVHIMGSHASEWGEVCVLALSQKATLEDLKWAPLAHPTLSEAIKEAAMHALAAAT